VNPERVTEPAATPPPPSDAPRSLREIGGLITLAGLAFAGVVGVVAVLDADSRPEGFGVGIGIAVLIFLVGATVACALACLVRGRMELVSLGAIVASCIAVDLIVLAVWLDIDNDAYAKTAGVAFVWSFFALIVLGLALAVTSRQGIALVLYMGAIAWTVVSGLIATWLIVTTGDEEAVVSGETSFVSALPLGNDALLQALGAVLVLLAAFWFAALAASRLDDQTLKRTLTTSPSSTT
jgi:hypothetical protein